jgi:hypothetical protein
VREQRTLVTLDGHFGDWVVLPLSEHLGVIRVKAHPLLPLLADHSPSDFHNKLVIASSSRVRWIQTNAK